MRGRERDRERNRVGRGGGWLYTFRCFLVGVTGGVTGGIGASVYLGLGVLEEACVGVSVCGC